MDCAWIACVLEALDEIRNCYNKCNNNSDEADDENPKASRSNSDEKQENEPMMKQEKQENPKSGETSFITQQPTQQAGTMQTVGNTYNFFGTQAPLAQLPGNNLLQPMVVPAAASVASGHHSGAPSSVDQNVLEWVPSDIDTAHTLVDRAVIGGYDIDESNLWIIRAEIAGELILGKLNNTHKLAFAAYKKDDTYAEKNVNKFDVCCYKTPDSRTKIRWIKNSKGQVPLNAFEAGWKANGERLYVGRARHDADNYPGYHTLCPGMIQPSHGVLYITYNHEVHTIASYEVLCVVKDEYH